MIEDKFDHTATLMVGPFLLKGRQGRVGCPLPGSDHTETLMIDPFLLNGRQGILACPSPGSGQWDMIPCPWQSWSEWEGTGSLGQTTAIRRNLAGRNGRSFSGHTVKGLRIVIEYLSMESIQGRNTFDEWNLASSLTLYSAMNCS